MMNRMKLAYFKNHFYSNRFHPDLIEYSDKILRETKEIFQMSEAAEVNFIGVDLLDEQV